MLHCAESNPAGYEELSLFVGRDNSFSFKRFNIREEAELPPPCFYSSKKTDQVQTSEPWANTVSKAIPFENVGVRTSSPPGIATQR